MKLIRVFPRKTKASPIDELAFYDVPPFYAEADKVNISVTFTYGIEYAEWLAEQWKHVAPVEVGGVAYGKPSGDFVAGRYLKEGYTITSRGCPNKCWFCSVWKREPELKELPIVEGWNVLDDNLLACFDNHIKAVFEMLSKQKKVEFTGGLEAKILKDWHVELLAQLKPAQMFFAYDTPDDYEPLVYASEMLRGVGFTRNQMRCYVLIGFPKDTIDSANDRLTKTMNLGYCPMAMLWKDNDGSATKEWKAFQRTWARPAIIYSKVKL